MPSTTDVRVSQRPMKVCKSNIIVVRKSLPNVKVNPAVRVQGINRSTYQKERAKELNALRAKAFVATSTNENTSSDLTGEYVFINALDVNPANKSVDDASISCRMSNQITPTPSKNSDKTTQRSWYTIEDIAEKANEVKKR